MFNDLLLHPFTLDLDGLDFLSGFTGCSGTFLLIKVREISSP